MRKEDLENHAYVLSRPTPDTAHQVLAGMASRGQMTLGLSKVLDGGVIFDVVMNAEASPVSIMLHDDGSWHMNFPLVLGIENE